MPSERSLYRKIQEVLETTKSVRVESLEDLRERLKRRPDRMFKTPQYNPEKDVISILPSRRVIRSTVRMCYRLGLVSEQGQLTDAGRQALRRARFESIVANRVRIFLKERGVDLAQMNRAIAEGLQSRAPVLPTSAALWQAVGSKVPKGIFTRLLTLLGHAGGAESTQRKIYLHISTE